MSFTSCSLSVTTDEDHVLWWDWTTWRSAYYWLNPAERSKIKIYRSSWHFIIGNLSRNSALRNFKLLLTFEDVMFMDVVCRLKNLMNCCKTECEMSLLWIACYQHHFIWWLSWFHRVEKYHMLQLWCSPDPSNVKQVGNLQWAQSNSASNLLQDVKQVVAYLLTVGYAVRLSVEWCVWSLHCRSTVHYCGSLWLDIAVSN